MGKLDLYANIIYMKYLTTYGIHIPGMNLLKYISFRAAMAVLFSLIIALVYGKRIINFLRTNKWENW
jgi:phospho-N-acetylmuramoyl-pentapeptide-transferase